MTLGPFEQCAGDLAPGDRGVLEQSWDSFAIETVRPVDDPLLDTVWRRLWTEFGARGEMERREVIADRLRWQPQEPFDGHALLYELLVIRHEGAIVAIRDHTAIVPPAALRAEAGAGIVVHLSHVLVEPPMRGCGLASWLRALPVETARRCLAMAGGAASDGGAAAARRGSLPPITLVAEMELDDGVTPAVRRRLRSYARAGFRVADPRRIDYHQPDFRSAADIEADQVRSVPLSLVMRRVGREHERVVTGAELRGIVRALQAMFAVHVRGDHMQGVRDLADRMPGGDERIALLVPGESDVAQASGREEE